MSEPIPAPTPAPSATEAVSSAEVRHVIIRACATCGGKREANVACGQCGSETAAQVDDLGIVTAIYRHPVRRVVWRLVGKPLADRRIRRANQRAIQLRADRK